MADQDWFSDNQPKPVAPTAAKDDWFAQNQASPAAIQPSMFDQLKQNFNAHTAYTPVNAQPTFGGKVQAAIHDATDVPVGNFARDLYHTFDKPQGGTLADYGRRNTEGLKAKFHALLRDPVGQLAMGAGDVAVGAAVGGAGEKALEGPSVKSSTNKLSFAAGKGATDDIAATLNDLRASAQHPVHSMDTLTKTATHAKQQLQGEADSALAPIANQQVYAVDVANKIRGLITPNMSLTADGLKQSQKIQNAALDFEREGWTYGKLDQERMDANARLSAYEKKNDLGQYAAKKSNRNVAIDKAIADGIRDVVYPQMDAAAGKAPGYFAQLKQRQGALIRLESHLKGRVAALTDETARIQGSPRVSVENMSVHPIIGEGGARPSIWGAKNILVRKNPMKEANRAVAGGMREGYANPGGGAAAGGVIGATLPNPYLSPNHPLNQPPVDDQR